MKIPFISLIFQGIPESIAVVTLAFVLAKIDIDWKKIIIFGFIIATSAYIIRLFPITFGIHTIILMGLLFIFLVHICKAQLFISLKASLMSYFILIIVEFSCFAIIRNIFGLSFETYLSDNTSRILISLPQVFILFGIAFIIFEMNNREGKLSEDYSN